MEHDEQISPSEAREALASIDRQRGTLADRLRFPSWYATLQSAAYVVLFVVPGLSAHGTLSHGAVVAAIVASVVVLGLANVVLRRAAGARLYADQAGAYGSVRRPMLVTGTIVLAGSLLTWALAESVSWVGSIACGLAVAAVAVRGRQRAVAAIRHDIRAGQVRAR